MIQTSPEFQQTGRFPAANPNKITQLIVTAHTFTDAVSKAEHRATELGMTLWQVSPCLNLEVVN